MGTINQEKVQEVLTQKTTTSPIRTHRSSSPARKKERTAMMLLIPVKFSNGISKEIEFLVDTGSEANLIRSDLVPNACWVQAKKKLNLYTANDTPMVGGHQYCSVGLKFYAVEVGKEEHGQFVKSMEADFYEADIHVDGIISYQWLENNKVGIFPHRGCLMSESDRISHWLFGGDLEEVMESWDDIPTSPIFTKPQKSKVRSVDDLTDRELEKILEAHNWVPHNDNPPPYHSLLNVKGGRSQPRKIGILGGYIIPRNWTTILLHPRAILMRILYISRI